MDLKAVTCDSVDWIDLAEDRDQWWAYVKIKISPLQTMKAHGGCECKGPYIRNHGTRKG